MTEAKQKMDWLKEVVATGGQLLRVERYVDRRITKSKSKSESNSLVPGILFTFDVGRILVWGNLSNQHLECEYIRNAEDVPPGLKLLDEEEPWWRVLGSPLVRIEPVESEESYELQFRDDKHNPRYISLTFEEGWIRVRCRNPHS